MCRGDEHGAALRLGVLWYRFDGDDSTAANDGRHTDYLCGPSRQERPLRECDPDLFEKMLHLVKNDRSIAAVEANHVLPADTVFFSEGLSFRGTPLGERSAKRLKWLNAGLCRVEDAEVVFFESSAQRLSAGGRATLLEPQDRKRARQASKATTGPGQAHAAYYPLRADSDRG